MPMRFLIIAGYADSLVRFRGPLISALQAAGAQVHVAAPNLGVGNSIRIRLEACGVSVHQISLQRTGTNPLSDIRALLSLTMLMRRIKPDAVLPYTIKPVIYGTLAAWLSGVPKRFALITGLGYAFTGSRGGLLTRLVMRLYAFSLSRTHKVFFQNPDDETLFRDKGILALSTVSVVVNGSGIDLAEFPVRPLTHTGPHFLMITRLLGDKGVREYAEAAAAIRSRHADVVFSLAGWIDSNPDAILQSELDAWITSGTLAFLGKLDHVQDAIAACSVYVLPSYREGTPRTVLEAMASGRAVITTDAPGCRETVIDGENGFLVPIRSSKALEQAMLKFITAPELSTRMSIRSREIAEEKYDVHKINTVMLHEMGIE